MKFVLTALLCAMAMPTAASADAPLHFARFTVTDSHPVTKQLARTVEDVALVSVRVNGRRLIFGDQPSDNTALMYGYGVALRFHQTGTRATVHAAAVIKRGVVTITYRVRAPVR